MRLTWEHDTPFVSFNLGTVNKGDIVDVLGKDEIEFYKANGFTKAPTFKGKEKEEKLNG